MCESAPLITLHSKIRVSPEPSSAQDGGAGVPHSVFSPSVQTACGYSDSTLVLLEMVGLGFEADLSRSSQYSRRNVGSLAVCPILRTVL